MGDPPSPHRRPLPASDDMLGSGSCAHARADSSHTFPGHSVPPHHTTQSTSTCPHPPADTIATHVASPSPGSNLPETRVSLLDTIRRRLPPLAAPPRCILDLACHASTATWQEPQEPSVTIILYNPSDRSFHAVLTLITAVERRIYGSVRMRPHSAAPRAARVASVGVVSVKYPWLRIKNEHGKVLPTGFI